MAVLENLEPLRAQSSEPINLRPVLHRALRPHSPVENRRVEINVGALIIRVGFWAPFSYSHIAEPLGNNFGNDSGWV